MDIQTLIFLVIGFIGLIFAYFQLIVPFAKGEVRLKGEFPFVTRAEEDSTHKKKVDETHAREPLPFRLLSLIWNYPLAGGNQSSWAVKESSVLRGDLKSAIEKPGLGIALFSTELAIAVFGEPAKSRIDACINWGLSRTQSEPPYLMYVEDPITSNPNLATDFRHTLALSIILARTQQHMSHLTHYLRLTLDSQREDGGWSPGNGITVSEEFTVLYAVELLTLCHDIESLPKESREKTDFARKRAIDWVIRHSEKNALWKTGVFNYPWGSLHMTAWVLHRLVPLIELSNESWIECVRQSLSSMIQGAVDS